MLYSSVAQSGNPCLTTVLVRPSSVTYFLELALVFVQIKISTTHLILVVEKM